MHHRLAAALATACALSLSLLWSVPAGAQGAEPVCSKCHEESQDSIKSTAHGRKNDASGSACQSCHGDATEHVAAKGKKPRAAMIDESEVPEKYRRYYRLLLDLRNHVLVQLGEHTEETLLKSSKDDSGDLSGYGQHMADAGTDTFDRDFALSLVSGEQEALAEIEAAIKRVHAGTYGICESTQKPIAKERLLAVPFTRYSAEAKKQVERHSHRAQQRGGLFGDGDGEEGGKIADDSGDDE